MESLKSLLLSIRVVEKSKKTSGLWHNDTSKNWAASSLCQSQSPQLLEMVNNKLTRPRRSWTTNWVQVRLSEGSSKLSHQHKDKMVVLALTLDSVLSNRD